MRQFVLFAFVATSLSIVGCAADTSSSSSSSTTDQLATTTVSDDLDDNVSVEADRVVFAASARKAGGALDELVNKARSGEPVILVGGRQKDAVNPDHTIREDVKNPNGYLRAALGVEEGPNGEVIFKTRKASLSEARDEMVRRGMVKMRGDGCWPQQSYPFTLFNIDLSRTLYEKNFGTIGRMTIGFKDSFLTIDGNLDTQVSGACLAPQDAHGILTTNLRGQIVLAGSFDGAFGATTGEVNIMRKRYDITSVMGYPLALDFSVTATCDFASNGKVRAEIGAKVNGSVKAGASWVRHEGFDGILEPTWPRFTQVGPTFTTNANVNANCTVNAKALALVFDSDEGPYANAAAFINVDATGEGSGASGRVRAKVVGGVDAGVGGTLKPFHITLVDQINVPRYHKEWTLFDQAISVGQ